MAKIQLPAVSIRWEGLAFLLTFQVIAYLLVKFYLEDAKQSKTLPPMTPNKRLDFIKHFHSYWKEVTFVASVLGPRRSH